jgi:lysozyme family protein
MNKFDTEMIDWLLQDIEGDVADLSNDRGGWTYKGLSSRYFPEIRDMYNAGTLTDAYIYRIYYTEYIKPVPMRKELQKRVPWLYTLLFSGRVHGSGDEDFTREVQSFLRTSTHYPVIVDGIFGGETARAVLSLNDVELNRLSLHLRSRQDTLADLRIASVGAYPDGIRNRVKKEFDRAFNTSVPQSDQVSQSSDAVKAYAKLSSVSSSQNARSVQVVDAHGWEQLPLGMDITIEIRGVDHASSTTISPAEVRLT